MRGTAGNSVTVLVSKVWWKGLGRDRYFPQRKLDLEGRVVARRVVKVRDVDGAHGLM